MAGLRQVRIDWFGDGEAARPVVRRWRDDAGGIDGGGQAEASSGTGAGFLRKAESVPETQAAVAASEGGPAAQAQLPPLSGPDTIAGSPAGETLAGGGGADVISGGGGNDLIFGFSSADANPNSGAIAAERVASGLSSPLFAASPPGDPDRLYIVEQHTGRIRILDLDTGAVAATPFLDLPDSSLATGGEEGLLGLAFHPDYAANGRFFVFLTNAAGDIEVRQYLRSAADPDVADAASGTLVLTIPHPGQSNHNGGWMGFGPEIGRAHV